MTEKKILIIGGTGMLQKATAYFISNCSHVSIVGRDLHKLKYFPTEFPERKNNMDLIFNDYSNTSAFIETIKSIIQKNGSFDIVICWMHSTSEDTLRQLLSLIGETNREAIFYHIKGSAYNNPAKTDHLKLMELRLEYREIFLGYKREDDISRWLTNTEISDGVIEAVVSNKKKMFIGQIEPWERRPNF